MESQLGCSQRALWLICIDVNAVSLRTSWDLISATASFTISCNGPSCGPGRGDLLQKLEDVVGSVRFTAIPVGLIVTVLHGRWSSLPQAARRSLAVGGGQLPPLQEVTSLSRMSQGFHNSWSCHIMAVGIAIVEVGTTVSGY